MFDCRRGGLMQSNKVGITALYCRLSRDDGNKESDSNSIENQKIMLSRYAQEKSCKLVCAEIDIKPEYNHPSMKFHKKMGFVEVGQKISKKTITVSLQIREIPDHIPNC